MHPPPLGCPTPPGPIARKHRITEHLKGAKRARRRAVPSPAVSLARRPVRWPAVRGVTRCVVRCTCVTVLRGGTSGHPPQLGCLAPTPRGTGTPSHGAIGAREAGATLPRARLGRLVLSSPC